MSWRVSVGWLETREVVTVNGKALSTHHFGTVHDFDSEEQARRFVSVRRNTSTWLSTGQHSPEVSDPRYVGR